MADTRTLPHRDAATDFAQRVREEFADAVETVLLYGSVARDEVRGLDSDVDLLVVLDDTVEIQVYEDRIRDLAYDVELEHGVVLSLAVTSVSMYQEGSPFFEHVRRDAESLYG